MDSLCYCPLFLQFRKRINSVHGIEKIVENLSYLVIRIKHFVVSEVRLQGTFFNMTMVKKIIVFQAPDLK